MLKRNFDEWLGKFRLSISGYDYYVDFGKVVKNVERMKVELNILNSLIGSNDIEQDFLHILKSIRKHLNAFLCFLQFAAMKYTRKIVMAPSYIVSIR